MRPLLQNTATTRVIGPFLDATSGLTAETALSPPTARIWKNGTTSTIGLTTGRTWVHDGDGFYLVGFSSADVDTLGELTIEISSAATHLPVWGHFSVLPASAYSALFNTGFPSNFNSFSINAAGQVNANAIALSGDTTAANNAESFFDGTGFSSANSTIPTVTTVTNGVTLANGAITAAKIGTDAIGGTHFADDAITKIQSGLMTSAGYTAPDNAGIAAIQAKTDSLAFTGTDVQATLSGETASANVIAISGDAAAADNAEKFFDNTGFTASNSVIGTATNITNGVTLADDAITAAKIDDSAIDADSIADSAVTKIQGGLMTSAGYTAPDNAGIVAIKAKTDLLTFTGTDVQATLSGETASANIIAISGDATAADNAEKFFDGTGYSATNSTIPTVTSITNGVTLATGAITATKIGAGAIGGTHLATDAITKIQSGLMLSGGTSIASSVLGDVVGKVIGGGATTITGVGAWVLANTGGTVASKTTIDAIKAKTDSLTFTGTDVQATLSGETTTANVVAISGDAAAADNAEKFFDNSGFTASNSIIGTATAVTNAVVLPATATIAITGNITGNLSGSVGSVGGTVSANVIAISGDVPAADNLEKWFDNTGYTASNSFVQSEATVAGTVDANIVQISGDSTAADNLEKWFDNTGYTASNSIVGVEVSVVGTVSANVIQISGDATAADNAEKFFDGTGYSAANSTIPTVTNITNVVSANITRISGDTTAADNLEKFFDNTGFTASNSVIGYVNHVGTGAGATGYTVTVNDGDGNPIDGVEVWITSDSDGQSVMYGTVSTDAFGHAVFYPDTGGTAFAWMQCAGYNFTNPTTIAL